MVSEIWVLFTCHKPLLDQRLLHPPWCAHLPPVPKIHSGTSRVTRELPAALGSPWTGLGGLVGGVRAFMGQTFMGVGKQGPVEGTKPS